MNANRTGLRAVFCALGLAVLGGCVPLSQEVPIYYPEPVGQNSASPLDKCPLHVYPHRLILAQAADGSPLVRAGWQLVGNQKDFDYWWGFIAPQLDEKNVPSGSLKPVVDWDRQVASFVPISADTTCEKARPYGSEMTTDCLAIQIPIYRYYEGGDCKPPSQFQVFVYIHPRSPLPLTFQWIYPTATPTPFPTATETPTPTPFPTPTPESEDE